MACLWSLIFANVGFARCVNPPIEKSATKSDLIFSGTLLKAVAMNNRNRLVELTFHANRAWKGYVSATMIVIGVVSPERPPFEQGETYLVYSDGTAHGRPFLGKCTQTKKLANAVADLKKLGVGQSLVTANEPFRDRHQE
ncbi:MAG: hypothetical protein HXY51_04920 [Nitrospirae bacterium]|nr:hypothetical protein [Nitrospirota bacterium]